MVKFWFSFWLNLGLISVFKTFCNVEPLLLSLRLSNSVLELSVSSVTDTGAPCRTWNRSSICFFVKYSQLVRAREHLKQEGLVLSHFLLALKQRWQEYIFLFLTIWSLFSCSAVRKRFDIFFYHSVCFIMGGGVVKDSPSHPRLCASLGPQLEDLLSICLFLHRRYNKAAILLCHSSVAIDASMTLRCVPESFSEVIESSSADRFKSNGFRAFF